MSGGRHKRCAEEEEVAEEEEEERTALHRNQAEADLNGERRATAPQEGNVGGSLNYKVTAAHRPSKMRFFKM